MLINIAGYLLNILPLYSLPLIFFHVFKNKMPTSYLNQQKTVFSSSLAKYILRTGSMYKTMSSSKRNIPEIAHNDSCPLRAHSPIEGKLCKQKSITKTIHQPSFQLCYSSGRSCSQGNRQTVKYCVSREVITPSSWLLLTGQWNRKEKSVAKYTAKNKAAEYGE